MDSTTYYSVPDHAMTDVLNHLARAKSPVVTFREDLDAMRKEAMEQREKSICAAFDILIAIARP